MLEPAAPAPDELEVSVFGPGFGECICVHAGGGEWYIIDSCIDAAGEEPAGLTYIRSLNLEPAEVVRLIVITHWDDDHIRGISEVVRVCGDATVVCSAALRREEIFEFVLEQEDAGGAAGSGVDELRDVLRLCRSVPGRLVWAKANLPLHPRPPGAAPTVVALSPSEEAVERSIESLIEAALQQDIAVPRRYKAPEGPNGASVAASVQAEGGQVLLGADLIKSPNTETGWDAVLRYARPALAASLTKIPHHASDGAHHDDVWEEMIEANSIAIVTPWTKADKFLPLQRDLDRLRALTDHLFLTSMPALKRVKKDPTVNKLIQKLHGDDVSVLTGWGQVRARRRPGEGEWRVELDGDAVAVPK